MDFTEAEERCICPTCPTDKRCEESIAFCFWSDDTSACIKEEHGCICPSCAVQIREGFEHLYYCLRGGEKSQSI